MIFGELLRQVKAVFTATPAKKKCVLCGLAIEPESSAFRTGSGWIHRVICPPQKHEPRSAS